VTDHSTQPIPGPIAQPRRRAPVAACTFVLLALVASGAGVCLEAQSAAAKGPVIIDADTANEIDDLYAIVRALLAPGLRVLALSSAQWNHRLSPPDSVMRSQVLNEDLVRLLGRQDIPLPMGAEMIMGKPWGGTEPSDSPAAQMIIRSARAMPEGQKLTVISLGAVTNVASAIRLAPDIAPRLACYVLGARFDSARQVWSKDEFNVRNDLNAFNYLLDAEGLELHVMPVNILLQFRFQQEETLRRLGGRGTLWDYLAARWLTHSPTAREWIMWDLALVQAWLRPELAEQAQFTTPPENTQRQIWVYTRIDRDAMLADWWETAESGR
jgi:purine nucleosidase